MHVHAMDLILCVRIVLLWLKDTREP
jgi:hypothetical protein